MSTQEQSGPAPRQASPHDVIGVGVAFSAAGLYFMLGAAGYVPMPETNSPRFIAFCAGLAFLFAGLTCVVRARAGMTDPDSDVPDSAPRWTKAVIPRARHRGGWRAGDHRHLDRDRLGPARVRLSARSIESRRPAANPSAARCSRSAR